MQENIFEIESLDTATSVARSAATAGLTFTNAGNNLVYCDNPEFYTLYSNGMHCNWGASIGTTYKDVEMYLNVGNGNKGTGQFRFGIAVQNTTGSAVTITYKYAGKHCSSANGSISISDEAQLAYLTAATKTKRIAANSVALLEGTDAAFAGANLSHWAIFHACLKASVSSGVYFRVFIAGASKMSNYTELFNIPLASWMPLNYSMPDKLFCGELGYSQKNCTMNANSSGTYVLCEWPKNKNANEYSTAITHKSGGNTILPGNYGVIYKMTIQNASGKRIRIVPYWDNPSESMTNREVSLVARFNGGTWQKLTHITMNQCWYRSLGSNSTATVEIMLPGGNCGDLFVSFD